MEAYKNKGDGERERGKIVFHSVTEVSELDSCPHPDSYLFVTEFKAAEVRQSTLVC